MQYQLFDYNLIFLYDIYKKKLEQEGKKKIRTRSVPAVAVPIVEDYSGKVEKRAVHSDQDESEQHPHDKDYNAFDYVHVLKKEAQREKENIARMAKDRDENEQERFERELLERQQRVDAEVVRLLDTENLEAMPQMVFKRLMHDDEVLGHLSKHILDEVYQQEGKKHSNIKVGEMKDMLKVVDKKLFRTLLKEGGHSMSYDQFKTRAFEKLQNKDDKYYCYDDLREILPQELSEQEVKQVETYLKTIHKKGSLKDVTLEDSLRQLQPWESSKKCLRSIFNLGATAQQQVRLRKKNKKGSTNPNLAFGASLKERSFSLGQQPTYQEAVEQEGRKFRVRAHSGKANSIPQLNAKDKKDPRLYTYCNIIPKRSKRP